MIRTSVLFDYYKDRNIYESKYGQNLQLLLPTSFKRKTGFIDKPLMKYIRQDNSLSQTSNPEISYKKEIENLYGYADIRFKCIKNLEDSEKFTWKIEKYYFTRRLAIALNFKRIDEAKYYFNMLKKKQWLELDIKILFYSNVNSLNSKVHLKLLLLPRIYRKIKKIF